MANTTRQNSSEQDDKVKSILKYLEDEDKFVHYPTHGTPNITLILGITGSGKSTLVHYIAGDPKTLYSEATKSRKGYVLGYRFIDTNQRIGNMTVKSHTKIPEFTLDPITNTSLYDCPGFEDNRDAKYDIGGTYFIKKIINKANAIKFVLVANYNSVTSNMNKTDFLKLLKHVTDMIKNVDKFKDAVCLVATKVNDGKDDTAIVESIAFYLTQVKEELENEAEQISTAESQQRARNIRLLDALLQERAGKYFKIGFIRQPEQAGLINEIPKMREGKKSLIQLIHNDTTFVPIDGDDFSYTISADSRNYINTLETETYDEISRNIRNITDTVLQHYDHSFTEMNQLLQSCIVDRKLAPVVTPSSAKTFVHQIQKGRTIIQKIIEDTQTASTMSKFFNEFCKNVAGSEFENSVSEGIVRVSELGNLFAFLQTFSHTLLDTSTWVTNFKSTASKLDTNFMSLRANSTEMSKEIHQQMFRDFNTITATVLQRYIGSIQEMDQLLQSCSADRSIATTLASSDAKIFADGIQQGRTIVRKIIDETQNATTASEFFEKFRKNIANTEIENTLSERVAGVSELANLLTFLQIFSDASLNVEALTTSLRDMATNIDKNVQKLCEKSVKTEKTISHETITLSGDAIKSYFSAKEAWIKDIGDISRTIDDGHRQVYTIRHTNFINNVTSTRCAQLIIDALTELNITSGEPLVSRIDANLDLLNYLSNVNTLNHRIDNSFECTSGFDAALRYLETSKIWYKFVLGVYDRLSEYNIQKDAKKYAEHNAVRASSFDEYQNKVIDGAADIKEFLRGCCQGLYSREYDNIKGIVLDKSKLDALKHVVDTALKTYSYDPCDQSESTLRIKGQLVKLSDVVNKTCTNTQVKFIEVFALHTIFIDASLNKIGDLVQLTIIAPRWEICDNQTIVLDGKAALNQPKAENAKIPGANGNDGKCGLDGGPAGSFLGFADTFVDLQNLAISARGGKGGDGQEGGDGADGESVYEDPKIEYYDDSWFGIIKHYVTRNPFSKYAKRGFQVTVFDEFSRIDYPSMNSKGRGPPEYSYYMNVDVFKKGGNGGNGGAGGCAGNSGDRGAVYIPITGTAGPQIDRSSVNASPGKGGQPARGGRNSKILRASIVRTSSKQITNQTKSIIGDDSLVFGKDKGDENWISAYTEEINDNGSRPGETGVFGQHVRKELLEGNAPIFPRVSYAINSYKNYIRENLHRNVRERDLRTFLDQLQQSPFIVGLYEVHGLVDELLKLEEQYYKLHRKISFLPFYKYLQRNIDSYTQQYTSAKPTEQNKKILNYLYTAILSRICNVGKKNNDLIVDLPSYIESTVLKEIKSLKTKIAEMRIAEIKTIYNNKIDDKINESRQFIESQVIPEINNAINQTDIQIHSLITEIAKARQKAIEDYDKAEKDQIKLQRQMEIKQVLGAIQVASQFLAFAGPWGATVGAAIGTTSTLTQGLAFSNDATSSITKIKEVPDAAKKSATAMKDLAGLQTSRLKIVVDEAKKALDDLDKNKPTDSSRAQLKEKITFLQREIEQSKNSVFADHANDELVPLLKSHLSEYNRKLDTKEQKIDELDKKKLKNDEAEIKWKSASLKLEIALSNGGTALLNTLATVEGDKAKVNENLKLLQTVAANIVQLEQHQKQISKVMVPAFETVWSIIDHYEETLQNQTLAGLDISRWKIQSTLNDLKPLVEKMAKGFEGENEIKRCVEKVEYAMTTMIQMYDRIEQYREDKELTDYIANINSATVNTIQIDDTELKQHVTMTEKIIQSNIVLTAYDETFKAFLQHQFPFVRSSLNKYEIPFNFQLNTTDDLVDRAVKKIEDMLTELKKDETSISQQKSSYKYVKIPFTGEPKALPPFFTWKKNKDIDKKSMSKLLRGQPIVLYANVANSGIINNAVKFNQIGIRFKFVNESIQMQFDTDVDNLSVEMIHLGNSYYKCGRKIYVMEHDRQRIAHSVNRNEEKEYTMTNDVYNKIKEAKRPILSPYAWWQIRLSYDRGGKYNFEALNKYSNEVSALQLVGLGEYVGLDETNDANLCENLDEYYTLHEVLPEISDTIINQRPIKRRKRRNADENIENADTARNQDVPRFTPQSPELTTKSSASSLMSPINSLFNWITNFFQPTTKSTDSVTFQNGFFGFNDKLPSIEIPRSSQNSEDSTPLRANTSIFDLNPFLLVADFAIRYFTKAKPVDIDAKSFDPWQVRACVLEIITDFEDLLVNIFDETSIRLEFQPVTLMGELEAAIINARHHDEIGNILYKSIVLENDQFPSSFGNYLMKEITALFAKQQHFFTDRELIHKLHVGEGRAGVNGVAGVIVSNRDKNFDFQSNVMLIE